MPSDVSTSAVQDPTHSASLPRHLQAEARDDDETSLIDLLIILAERKGTVLGVTAAFAVAAIIISFILPKRYTASVTLLPPQQGSASLTSILASQLGGLGSMASMAGGLGIKNPNDTYVAMLKSRTVEDAMIQRFGLMQEYKARYISVARKRFESNAKVDGSGKDGLIHISIEDKDPKRAAAMANGYVDEFRRLSGHLAITEAAQRRLFFEQQLEQAKNNLANAEEALKTTEQETGLIQPNSQATALIQAASTLRAEITAKEVQIQGMGTYATGENAQMIQAEHELDSLRTQLARLGGDSNTRSDGLIIPKGRVPQAGLEYIRKVRDVKYYDTIFEILARQFEAAKLDEAKQGALIQVVDPAIPPDRKSSPNRALIILASTFLGFMVGILIVFFPARLKQLEAEPGVGMKLQILRKAWSAKKKWIDR